MAINFPDSPSNGDTHTAGGKTFTYDSTVGAWSPAPAGATTFIGLTDTPNSFGTASQIPAINSGANALEFIALPSSVTVYATVDLLPLSGNSAGDQALVTATNRLYIWNGSGWYNIALINTSPTISGVASSYTLASDGTDTVITITATDPEGLPITYSIASDTSGNIATVTQNANVFTITPSTNTANAGSFSLTFRASDGVNIASAISEFTLAFSVQNSNYTTALITSVGTNNQVNNAFVDSSSNSHTITAAGNATQTTFSPYRHGGYSTYFDGSGDYLSSTITGPGTGDFTYEFWYYPTNSSFSGTSFNTRSSANSGADGFDLNLTSTSIQATYTNVIWLNVSTSAIEAFSWNHIALVRNSGTVTIYVNGISVGTASQTSNFSSTSFNLFANVLNGTGLSGNVTDFRYATTAVYTSAFTPPTERLTAITNTSLLTCHLPYIADGSTNDHSITVNGNTKTEPFSPFDYETYSAADNGGSMYFDGNGDYLSVPDDASLNLGTGDFTIEGWVWIDPASVDYAGLLGKRNQTNWNNGANWRIAYRTSGVIDFDSNLGAGPATPSVKINSWNHFAFCKSGTTIYSFLNGSQGTPVTGYTYNLDNTESLLIGRNITNVELKGSLTNIRIVKGTALYTSNFTPPTAPLTAITNTSLLLNGTNVGIIDKSQSAQTLTLNGDVKSSTTQTKYLSSSMYFDGTGDYIDLPDFVSDYGSKDFTVEVWIYPTAVGTRHNFGDFNSAGQNASSSLVFKFDNDKAKWWIQTTTYNSITSAASISANVWTHIALVRNGSTITQYINGNSDGTFNVGSASINQSSIVYTLGTGGDYQSDFYQGYMSDFRVTKGLARYTANFTPPTAALQG